MSKSKPEPNADERLGAAVRAIVERTGGCILLREKPGQFTAAAADSVEPHGAAWWRDPVKGDTLDAAAQEAQARVQE